MQPDGPLVMQAVPERSAVGCESIQWTGRACSPRLGRLVECYQSALESRIGETLSSSSPVFRCLADHTSANIHRFTVNAAGQTPYEHNHGREAYQQQVEFGERVVLLHSKEAQEQA